MYRAKGGAIEQNEPAYAQPPNRKLLSVVPETDIGPMWFKINQRKGN